jgi:hypothetical protein
LLFWGLHCNGKFDDLTISYALDYPPQDIERELLALIETRVVDRYVEEGITLYSLTSDEEKRRPIVEWARPGHSST